jgi:hypothetical protein
MASTGPVEDRLAAGSRLNQTRLPDTGQPFRQKCRHLVTGRSRRCGAVGISWREAQGAQHVLDTFREAIHIPTKSHCFVIKSRPSDPRFLPFTTAG